MHNQPSTRLRAHRLPQHHNNDKHDATLPSRNVATHGKKNVMQSIRNKSHGNGRTKVPPIACATVTIAGVLLVQLAFFLASTSTILHLSDDTNPIDLQAHNRSSKLLGAHSPLRASPTNTFQQIRDTKHNLKISASVNASTTRPEAKHEDTMVNNAVIEGRNWHVTQATDIVTDTPKDGEPTATATATATTIPRVLIFTYHRNLLDDFLDPPSNYNNNTSNINSKALSQSQHSSEASKMDTEEHFLAENVRHSIDVHSRNHTINKLNNRTPPTIVRFLTDQDCIESLEKVYPKLIPYFINETKGMFKGDICRGSALYETGGIYLDADLGVRYDLWSVLDPDTEFVTSRVHRQSKHPGDFFQAVLGTTKENVVIWQYLGLFYQFYTTGKVVKTSVKDGGTSSKGVVYVRHSDPLGVVFLRQAWDLVQREEIQRTVYGKTNMVQSEMLMEDHDGDRNKLDTMANRIPKAEIWQEVLYDRRMFPLLKHPPTWGTRRACHFIVVARAHNRTDTGIEQQGHKKGDPIHPTGSTAPIELLVPRKAAGEKHDAVDTIAFHVPLYSRVAGSRICPTNVSTWST